MSLNELRSQLYAFLGDATSNPDGDAWDHDRLRAMVDRLVKLPAIRADYFEALQERNEAEARGAGAVELLRRVVMDYVPDHCDEHCVCSAAAARQFLTDGTTP